jgi:hypothetical protein
LRLVTPANSLFDQIGLEYNLKHVESAKDIMGLNPWLVGAMTGVRHVAEAQFNELAHLTCAVLAVYVASRYKGGATGFRFVPVMGPANGGNRYAYFSWDPETRFVGTTFGGSGKQRLELNEDGFNDLAQWPVLETALDLIARSPRNDLESAIIRSLYWFGDAQRDALDVMQLVKYWSCVECFFSDRKDQIANAVCTGLAAILVFGDYSFVEEAKYQSIKKQLKKLYDLRSRALHGAMYTHVDAADVAALSQWVGWMVTNMLSFLQRGFNAPGQVRVAGERLDAAFGARQNVKSPGG